MVVRIIKKDDDVVSSADLIDDIKKSKKVDEAGAIFTFEGIVRGKEPGKKVDKLILKTPDIEKAEKEMNEIAEDVKTKFGVFEVNIIHYIGEFYTGDSLFIVAILGPHRQKSYEALIDTIERVKFDIDFEKEEISNQGSKTILAGG
ncbi:molybdenum cofactor biosynthesis protein MoaE [Methanobrevibacter wolinii]|uniref:molybdenum cofactor biosynthesis protein MoaE n=1 Tax=Methanobrevibacter wolinii TaxID=190977 RepID=UPI0005B2833A|nr:molybdenum cofactor biosynthesis protein MoaE [Methanobrevibacter wolinii]MDD5959620.1 molybdenum cofactor biosynthesis protein MoaE [Methanobrevibacter wolinii]